MNAPVHKVLNLGSGKKVIGGPGAVTIDKSPLAKPDILHDLNQTPWPLESGRFDAIHCHDIIEHLTDVVRTMEEIHRVAKPGARVYIVTPHYSSSYSFQDPTHKQHLGIFSFDYFTGENEWDFYTAVRFKKIRAHFVFHPTLINKLVWRLAQRFPAAYEKYWAWIFPAWFMSFELEVIK